FTGSTAVGRQVMRAAAENLTPVTLELGGKSPAIVAPGYDVGHAVERILFGKCLNAGQTCIAPDYVLLPEGSEEAFVTAARVFVARRYPRLPENPDYSAIISPRHHERLLACLADAASKGARVIPLAESDCAARKLAPAIVLGARDDMRIVQDEIFGPVLPIVSYRSEEH